MRMFLSLSVVKLVMQAMYFGYQPFFYDVYTIETVWFLKLTDICKYIILVIFFFSFFARLFTLDYIG